MYKGYKLKTPFFEYGPKAYMYGKELLNLAKEMDKLAEKYDVDIILDPQAVDLRMICENTKRIHVYAQHMDSIPVGRGMGTMLPEAIKATGAVGVILNHAEKKLTLQEIKESIKRADEVGLATMVCGDTLQELREIAKLGPNIIVAEPTELIGTGRPADKAYVTQCIELIHSINPEIMVLPSAGIKCGNDCYNIVRAGADGSGCSSAIAKAKDPAKLAEEMISAVRRAYNEVHNINL
jgi:triosephosphate isomerase